MTTHKKTVLKAGFWFLLLIILALSNLASAQGFKSILSIEAYDWLNKIPNTFLIDVRTRAEYQFVGHPTKAYLFPYMFMTKTFNKKDETYQYAFDRINKKFVDEIGKKFKKTDNLLIISRDGSRSILAAKELFDAGFKNVVNIKDGFEGPEFPTFEDNEHHKYYRQLAKTNNLPSFKHRRHYGWQWWGLPWSYEMDPKYIYPPDSKPPAKK